MDANTSRPLHERTAITTKAYIINIYWSKEFQLLNEMSIAEPIATEHRKIHVNSLR